MADSNSTTFNYHVKDLDVVSVTVYQDRAEVKRAVVVKAEKTGLSEVVVSHLTSTCDLDSFRVEGTGNAIITEVTSSTKLEEIKKEDDSENESIQNQLSELSKEIGALNDEKTRVSQQKEIVIALGEQVKTPKEKNLKPSPISAEGLDGVVKFLSIYGDQLKHCDRELYRLNGEIEELAAKRKVLVDKNFAGLRATDIVKTVRQVSVLLDVKEAGEITLMVSYLVSKAKWTPKYDIRGSSANSSVQVTYFGLITQQSGEDWNDTKVYLSTAQPGVGGDIPDLPRQVVNFKPDYSRIAIKSAPRAMKRSAFLQQQSQNVSFGCEESEEIEVATAEVQTGMLSTTYEVTRRSSIPSDNTEHKVTVAMFNLKATFDHMCRPKVVSSAFLKASLINDSQYIILAGPCSIFMDNSFIAKSSLPDVSPAEKFECSFGVDFAVKVNYKPCNKIQASAGMISKTIVDTYKQVITIKNTRRQDIRIQVEDQLPRSTNQKIKVSLVSPVVPKDKHIGADSPVTLNSDNNVVWKLDIKAGKLESLLLHYTVERLSQEQVEFSQAF